MKYKKRLVLGVVLKEIKEGLNFAEIGRKYDVSRQTLSYSAKKLKGLGCIEKLPGYANWKWIKDVPIRPKDTSKVNSDIRGHAFIWNVEFLDYRFDWNQTEINYKKRKPNNRLTFKRICKNKVLRIIFKGRKIWLTKTGLTIYEPLDFIGESSFTVKGTAVYEMDRLVKKLLNEFKLPFQHYRFKCSREHYAHVKNQMARQFNDNKVKIKVDHEGKWFWIDHSHGDQEEETNDPNTSVQAKKFYKSQLKTNFEVTPEKVLEMQVNTNEQLNKLANQSKKNEEKLEYYAENQITHVKLMQSIDANLEKQTKFFEEMKKFMMSK